MSIKYDKYMIVEKTAREMHKKYWKKALEIAYLVWDVAGLFQALSFYPSNPEIWKARKTIDLP